MKRFLFLIATAIISISASALQPQCGYRGFVDWSNYLDIDLGFLVGEGGETKVFTGFTTSHGYQFNNWLFVGGGAGYEYNLNWKKYHHRDESRYVIPVFAEARLDARWNRFTPFFSVRLGANLAEHGGIYFSPTVGYRFNWGRKSAINFGLGVTLYGKRWSYQDYIEIPDGGLVLAPETSYRGTVTKFTVSLGYEFQLP